MPFTCEKHKAFLYDRGGEHQIGLLEPMFRVKWNRRRDDVSSATAYIATPDLSTCSEYLNLVEAGRSELVIFRGDRRVWEGPVVRVAFHGPFVEIEAHDVMHYAVRTIMRNEYDNRYPNVGKVVDRVDRILRAELARKEALNPPINVLEHLDVIYATAPAEDARTAAHTLPYEATVFQHLDQLAARGGMDYTVVGRSILLFDVNTPLGQTAMLTMDDFIGRPVITQYGMELGTYVAMTDGEGAWGAAGGNDPFYGEWELLHQAYDESAREASGDTEPPSKAELESQALRTWKQSRIPPTVLRIPDNTRLNPEGALSIDDLVPGVHVPMHAELPGRAVSQMQKLDNMSVEESSEGEFVKVTLSPAIFETPPTLVTYSPMPILTAHVMGVPSMRPGKTFYPTGLATAEGVGTPVATKTLTVIPVGIDSAEVRGTPAMTGTTTFVPTAIATGEALGVPEATIAV